MNHCPSKMVGNHKSNYFKDSRDTGYDSTRSISLYGLYYYMKNFCNLIGLEQWYFTLI